MLFALALALDIAAAPTSSCAPAAVQPAIQAALTALKTKDTAGAKAAIESAVTCPVADGPTYAAHVLRASLAVGDQDWPTARTMLAGTGFHSESTLGAQAGFIRLRVDQAIGDAKAFTADRTTMLALNEGRLLAAGGTRREIFAVPGGTVAAYDAPIDQGPFHRVFEFVATPDDPAAYPVTIQLTDDRGAISLQKAISAQKGSAAPNDKPIDHVWFVDLYTCGQQATLAPPHDRTGDQPNYNEIRARVVATFADPNLLAAAPPPERSECRTGKWIVPGFGQPRKSN